MAWKAKLLDFDGRVALTSNIAQLQYLDVLAQPPVVLGTLTAPHPVTSATTAGEHLLATTDSAVSVVYPPCPAP